MSTDTAGATTASAADHVFHLPDLGEGLTSADVVEWLVAEGDPVATDQDVVVVETAKAAVEVPCPFAGTVRTLHVAAGESLDVGAALITIAPLGRVAPQGEPPAGAEQYRTEERAGATPPAEDEGSGAVLIGYGTGRAQTRRRRRANASARVAAGDAGEPRASADEAPGTAVGTAPASGRPAPGAAAGPPPGDTASPEPSGGPANASSSDSRTPGSPGAADPLPAAESSRAVRVISPLVRRLAAEHDLDLRHLRVTEPDGIVRRADVERALATSGSPTARTGATGADHPHPGSDQAAMSVPRPAGGAPPEPDVPTGAGRGIQAEELVPLTGFRAAIAEKLSRSRREIPDATTWVDVDATEFLAAKRTLAQSRPEAGIGVLALLARVCVAGLARFPELNASVVAGADGQQAIARHAAVHLGVAVQSPRGLVVPVVRDAHLLSTTALAARLREQVESARAGTLTPADLVGGTFTLNNYGVFGVDGSTPILNHPEAAMLGVGRITPRPWAHEGHIALREVTQVSFTFDHRVCDGGVAGGFLRYVADCLEQPATLLADL